MVSRGQAWSMDLIIGVLVFMVAVGIIYSLFATRSRDDTTPLRIESEVVANKLSDGTLAVAPENQLDTDRLSQLAGMNYDDLKRDLGVDNEFCIYLRDETGNLTYIVAPDGSTYSGVGSGNGDLNLSGTPCGCKAGTTPANCKA